MLITENIMWLTVDNIHEKESAEFSEPAEVPNLVGSGVSVGAVVSDTVGASNSRQVTIFVNSFFTIISVIISSCKE